MKHRQYKKEEIQSIVNTVICQFNLKYPLDLELLVRLLNGIINTNAKESYAEIINEQLFEINVTNVSSLYEYRHEVAKQIGSIFLNYDLIKEDPKMYTINRFTMNPYKRQAELFANMLLLPSNEVDKCINGLEDRNYKIVELKLSERFNVSIDLAYIRLKELGYLDSTHCRFNLFGR